MRVRRCDNGVLGAEPLEYRLCLSPIVRLPHAYDELMVLDELIEVGPHGKARHDIGTHEEA